MRATIENVHARARNLFRTDQSASAFLSAPCSALGGVPLELARNGRAAEVLFYLDRLVDRAPADPPLEWVPGYRPSA